jgi:hypothetical protein
MLTPLHAPQGKHTAVHEAAKFGRLAELKLMVEGFGAKTTLRDEVRLMTTYRT